MANLQHQQEEIWESVPGYEGLYEVSNFGRVKSCARKSIRKFPITIREKILKPSFEAYGYLKVSLSKGKTIRTHKVHRLVALAFIPNPENKPCINHLDSNPKNSSLSNLEWCTHQENMLHARSKGRFTSKPRATKPKSIKPKLLKREMGKTVYQYSKTKEFIKKWPSIIEIVNKGIVKDRHTITECCLGRLKKGFSKGYIWSYSPL